MDSWGLKYTEFPTLPVPELEIYIYPPSFSFLKSPLSRYYEGLNQTLLVWIALSLQLNQRMHTPNAPLPLPHPIHNLTQISSSHHSSQILIIKFLLIIPAEDVKWREEWFDRIINVPWKNGLIESYTFLGESIHISLGGYSLFLASPLIENISLKTRCIYISSLP